MEFPYSDLIDNLPVNPLEYPHSLYTIDGIIDRYFDLDTVCQELQLILLPPELWGWKYYKFSIQELTNDSRNNI